MNVIQSKHKEIQVYDNHDFKPCMIDNSSLFSVRCCFCIDKMWYIGSFCFENRKWRVLPSDIKKEFLDYQVCLWFYLPDLPDGNIEQETKWFNKNRVRKYVEGEEPQFKDRTPLYNFEIGDELVESVENHHCSIKNILPVDSPIDKLRGYKCCKCSDTWTICEDNLTKKNKFWKLRNKILKEIKKNERKS